MSSSNCCIQISQEAGEVVWYSHHLKNFPRFVVIHTVKGFGVVNKAEVDVFLELSCFFDDPMDVSNLISGSSAFSKTNLNIWNFMAHEMLKQLYDNLNILWHCLSLGLEWKLTFLRCWVFEICWHNECSTWTASPFRIQNSSARIPSSPLALLIVMLSKAHLTSNSWISGSRWVTTPSWLSGSLRIFFFSYRSSVYSCHLFLISSASVRFLPFLSFIVPIFAWNIPLIFSIFLQRSLVVQSPCRVQLFVTP